MSSRKDETNARDTYVSSFPRAPSTSDSVRLKCREMLAAALRTGGKFSVFQNCCPLLMFPIPMRDAHICFTQGEVVANRSP